MAGAHHPAAKGQLGACHFAQGPWRRAAAPCMPSATHVVCSRERWQAQAALQPCSGTRRRPWLGRPHDGADDRMMQSSVMCKRAIGQRASGGGGGGGSTAARRRQAARGLQCGGCAQWRKGHQFNRPQARCINSVAATASRVQARFAAGLVAKRCSCPSVHRLLQPSQPPAASAARQSGRRARLCSGLAALLQDCKCQLHQHCRSNCAPAHNPRRRRLRRAPPVARRS